MPPAKFKMFCFISHLFKTPECYSLITEQNIDYRIKDRSRFKSQLFPTTIFDKLFQATHLSIMTFDLYNWQMEMFKVYIPEFSQI